ncbi:hypothetical protein H0H87_007318, partial [Tephrocybe sp. NHM501043]
LAEDLSPDDLSPDDRQELRAILKLLNKTPSSTTDAGERAAAIFENVDLYETQASSRTHVDFFATLATGASRKNLAAREDEAFKRLFRVISTML